jgi:hypothetical protein
LLLSASLSFENFAPGTPAGTYSQRAAHRVGAIPEGCSPARVRYAKKRRALARSAPFQQNHFAMGGSGGNTREFSTFKEEKSFKPTTQIFNRI